MGATCQVLRHFRFGSGLSADTIRFDPA